MFGLFLSRHSRGQLCHTDKTLSQNRGTTVPSASPLGGLGAVSIVERLTTGPAVTYTGETPVPRDSFLGGIRGKAVDASAEDGTGCE